MNDFSSFEILPWPLCGRMGEIIKAEVVSGITIPPLDILSVVVQTRDMKYENLFRRNSYYDLNHNCHTTRGPWLVLRWSRVWSLASYWSGSSHHSSMSWTSEMLARCCGFSPVAEAVGASNFWDLVNNISGSNQLNSAELLDTVSFTGNPDKSIYPDWSPYQSFPGICYNKEINPLTCRSLSGQARVFTPPI